MIKILCNRKKLSHKNYITLSHVKPQWKPSFTESMKAELKAGGQKRI